MCENLQFLFEIVIFRLTSTSPCRPVIFPHHARAAAEDEIYDKCLAPEHLLADGRDLPRHPQERVVRRCEERGRGREGGLRTARFANYSGGERAKLSS
jgi:hypothetical protein